MLRHVCLLLFIITTDKISSLSQTDCGGDVSLDQGPVGHIVLPLPRLSGDGSPHTDKSVLHCTWMIEIPQGRTLLLKLERGASVSVLCGYDKGARHQVLESEGGALLRGCEENKANITWTGAGHSPNEIQLSYHVQEDERNSWSDSDHTSPHSARNPIHWAQTGTSFPSTVPVSQGLMTRTEEVRGHLHGVEESSPGLYTVSSRSSQDRELLRPTSPLQGLGVAGRGTPPFPEEGPNNGADTSGTAHNTDGPVSATHPYFQHTLHTDLFNTENTDTGSRKELRQTQATHTDTHTFPISHSVRLTSGQQYRTQATSNFPLIALFYPGLHSRTTRDGATILPIPPNEDVSATPKPGHSHSWRIHRSTNGLVSDSITSDPSKSPFTFLGRDSGDVHAGTTESYAQAQATAQFSTTAYRSSVSPEATEWTRPNTSPADSVAPSISDESAPTGLSESASKTDHGAEIHTQTAATQRTESVTHAPHTVSTFTPPQTTTENTQHEVTDTHKNTDDVTSVPGVTNVENSTLNFAGSSLTPGDGPASLTVESTTTETQTLRPTYTLPHEHTRKTSAGPSLPFRTFIRDAGPSYRQTTRSVLSSSSLSPSTSPSTNAEQETVPAFSHAPTFQVQSYITTSQTALPPSTTAGVDVRHENGHTLADDAPWPSIPSLTTAYTSTTTPSMQPPHRTTGYSGREIKSRSTSSAAAFTSAPTQRSTSSQTPRFYIVPDQPAVVRAESIELLLQIIVEESQSASNSGLEEDATAWVEVFLQKAPGFSRVLGVWSSGHAVQILMEFKTSGALQWLSETGPNALLEKTGLAEAVRERKEFRSSKVVNITLGGLQGHVCDWLLQCPSGYKCLTDAANYTCSSLCRFDYCHHHGLCTHHPGELPVCRCLVGEDFWYMGQRCDMRMTRTRLVGACLAILVIIVTVIGVLALVAVRRYRAILIQAKVDQTRSSYRRFNHFDELSGRFWLRSLAGSADSMDNPAFTRSDELLHLRALDRPCCYHDDTLSLASTCPSHGTRINTIYPHSSQYGWRGSEMSMGDGVLDSGKASDLSVCSWPVEPIHWTPFPILQQLASHRTPTVRVSRPRSYCEGMELVEIGKSWTA